MDLDFDNLFYYFVPYWQVLSDLTDTEPCLRTYLERIYLARKTGPEQVDFTWVEHGQVSEFFAVHAA